MWTPWKIISRNNTCRRSSQYTRSARRGRHRAVPSPFHPSGRGRGRHIDATPCFVVVVGLVSVSLLGDHPGDRPCHGSWHGQEFDLASDPSRTHHPGGRNTVAAMIHHRSRFGHVHGDAPSFSRVTPATSTAATTSPLAAAAATTSAPAAPVAAGPAGSPPSPPSSSLSPRSPPSREHGHGRCPHGRRGPGPTNQCNQEGMR